MKKQITKIFAIATICSAFALNAEAQDMGATALVKPTSPMCAASNQVVTVTIKNFSASDIDFSTNPTDVVVDMTGPIAQSFTVTISTGTLVTTGTMNVDVTTAADLSAAGTYIINANTVVAGDLNATNDAMIPVSIIVNALPVVNLGADVTLCGGTITLDAGNPGSSYLWSNTSTGQTLLVSATGTYSVVVTDVNTCTGSDIVNVTINTPPTVSLGSDVTQCGGTVILDAGNAGSTYAWSDASTNQTLTVSATGTYSVVVTDANTCTGSDIINVTINTPPTVALGADVTQCGGTVMLDAGNAGSAYAWSDASTNQTLTVSATGTYSVVVTDANTCTGSDIINVTINTPPTVALGGDVTQCGGTVMLDAANSGSSYLWSNASTNQTLLVSVTGTYSVVVTDGNGCTGSDVATITINTPSTVNLGSDVTQCGGTVLMDAGNSGFTYLWSDASTNQTLTVAFSGTYSVTVTAPNGCSASDAMNVTIDTPPAVSLGADVTQCGGTVILDAGNVGSTYAWSDLSTNQTLTVSATGTYSVTVSNSCSSASGTINVTINTPPTVSLGADVTQCGSVILDAGNAGSTYAWSDLSTNQTLTVSATGTYSVVVTDANTCTGSGSVNVTINTPPTVSLGADVTQCGGTIMLDAGNAGSTYAWSDLSTNQTLTASLTGTYSVVVTDANTCTGSGSVNVTIGTAPTVSFSITSPVCGNSDGVVDAIVSGGTGPYQYAWNNANTTSSVTGLVGSPTDTVIVTVTDANSCVSLEDTALVNCVTAIVEKNAGTGISVYPNPSNG
ncbi:MAG: SprB repeat-containing protein, partial [Bacteroidia bacterium]|nr:SprB repeat-containing protein [Bacteroidia bacterium]